MPYDEWAPAEIEYYDEEDFGEADGGEGDE